MLDAIKLLLPALIPSWRFFDEIAPSPRIEFSLLNAENETPQNWREFRPRPQTLSMATMLKRIFWNPHWNETLYLVSCAERLMQNETEHSAQEIFKRIETGLPSDAGAFLQFRLVFIGREGGELEKYIPYISALHPLYKGARYEP